MPAKVDYKQVHESPSHTVLVLGLQDVDSPKSHFEAKWHFHNDVPTELAKFNVMNEYFVTDGVTVYEMKINKVVTEVPPSV